MISAPWQELNEVGLQRRFRAPPSPTRPRRPRRASELGASSSCVAGDLHRAGPAAAVRLNRAPAEVPGLRRPAAYGRMVTRRLRTERRRRPPAGNVGLACARRPRPPLQSASASEHPDEGGVVRGRLRARKRGPVEIVERRRHRAIAGADRTCKMSARRRRRRLLQAPRPQFRITIRVEMRECTGAFRAVTVDDTLHRVNALSHGHGAAVPESRAKNRVKLSDHGEDVATCRSPRRPDVSPERDASIGDRSAERRTPVGPADLTASVFTVPARVTHGRRRRNGTRRPAGDIPDTRGVIPDDWSLMARIGLCCARRRAHSNGKRLDVVYDRGLARWAVIDRVRDYGIPRFYPPATMSSADPAVHVGAAPM